MGVSAGRVLLIPKGDWNAETTYTGLDWVRHNGATWVCKNTCTNIEPTEANSDNWQILARDGQKGTETIVDAAISDTSENPVQNKVIKKYVDEHVSEVDDMTGATATQNGAHGLVPAPKMGDEKKALLGNGTWGNVDAIFTYKTKAEYDAAVENDEIPDGAKVIKEYDEEGQLYLTDVDTAVSNTSTNPVQNKVVTDYIDARKSSVGQNLIPYPYYRPDSHIDRGITFTVNEDGSVTANGTATNTAHYCIFKGQLGLEIGKYYVLTLTTVKGKAALYLANANKHGSNTDLAACRNVNDSTLGTIFKYSQTDDFDNDEIGLYITGGTTLTNCIIKFQLERGTLRHEYQPTTLSNSTLKKKIEGIKVPEIVELTRNNIEGIDTTGVQCFVKNGIAYVNIVIIYDAKEAITSWTNIVSNLPIPAYDSPLIIYEEAFDADKTLGSMINKNGELMIMGSTFQSGKEILKVISYPIA